MVMHPTSAAVRIPAGSIADATGWHVSFAPSTRSSNPSDQKLTFNPPPPTHRPPPPTLRIKMISSFWR